MNFDFSEAQVLLRESVARFGARHYHPEDRCRMLGSADAGAAAARWRAMADMGLLGLTMPEANGGYGGDAVDVMAVMDGVGRHLMLEPFATSCVFAPAVLCGASGATAVAALSALNAGEITIAPALGEADAGFDLHRVATRADATPRGYSLSGVKTHAEDGADADWFIVSARITGAVDDRDGIGLFLVARTAPGLIVERFRAIDHHCHARLTFDAVQVEADALLCAPGEGLTVLEEAVDRVIAAHLAEAVGSMDALRAMTLAHLKTRKQFGVPIGTFQVLQHRMVDIETACEEARSMVFHATLHLGAERGVRRRAVSAAKVRVGQCSLFAGRQALQLHGGMGMSAELLVSHHLKRLMMLDMAYGNAEHHRTAFANAA